MNVLELSSHPEQLTVDWVGQQSYGELLMHAYETAEELSLGLGMSDVTFGLLDELHNHDVDAALGGLRTFPIALEIADEIADFYDTEIDQRWVFVTSLLHDIGKQKVSQELLIKSSFGASWTSEDAFRMRRHVQAGGEIFRAAGLPESVARATEEHHHKQQGSPSYGINPNLDYEARIYRDATALADYEEADLNRTNSRNWHLNRDQRIAESARNMAFVLSDYSESRELTQRVIARSLGAEVLGSQLLIAA